MSLGQDRWQRQRNLVEQNRQWRSVHTERRCGSRRHLPHICDPVAALESMTGVGWRWCWGLQVRSCLPAAWFWSAGEYDSLRDYPSSSVSSTECGLSSPKQSSLERCLWGSWPYKAVVLHAHADIHTHTHTHALHTHTYILHKHLYIHTHTFTSHTHVYTSQTHIHTYTHTHMHIHTPHTNIYTHTYTYLNTYIHNTHTYTRTYFTHITHTFTCIHT